MGKILRPKIPCARPGCKLFAMSDGSGFCGSHNPALAERRKQVSLKGATTMKLRNTPEVICVVEGCKTRRYQHKIYCVFHTRLNDPALSQKCFKESCRRRTGIDSAGYCFSHSPLKTEGRNRRLIKLDKMRKEARCCRQGCRGFPMRDGSGFCYHHNPALAEKRSAVAELHSTKNLRSKIPPQRVCKIKGCKNWTQDDGSHLCYHHHPLTGLNLRNRLRVHHHTRGLHLPWLGLRDINEAHRLIFYAFETNQPLLALRGITKVASLYARGEVYIPQKHKIEEPEDSGPLKHFGVKLKNQEPPPD